MNASASIDSELYVDYLIIGAGISGLATANALFEKSIKVSSQKPSLLIVEKEHEAGGYCRTVHQDGFIWDYSGHFFHFRYPEIHTWFQERMPRDSILTVSKKAKVLADGVEVEAPYQKNIHQLPSHVFLQCLTDLYAAQHDQTPVTSFGDMVRRRYGQSIAEKFLIPYNEKLYATSLDNLDVDAMGRFFPHVNFQQLMEHFAQVCRQESQDTSYNATMTYPKSGAEQYVKALLKDLPSDCVFMSTKILKIDANQQIAFTKNQTIHYKNLISSVPFPQLLSLASVAYEPNDFTANQVLVFNLGFDSKGRTDVHWLYCADRSLPFYRIGFYDNILQSSRMSLYIEIGMPQNQTFDQNDLLNKVMTSLQNIGIVTTQKLISHHAVLMNPAYVHLTSRSQTEVIRLKDMLEQQHIYSIGRYGSWTYCSIEDNILEARNLVQQRFS